MTDLKIVICDDIKQDRENIKKQVELIEVCKGASIKTCSPEELLGEIDKDSFDYNIAIMDIEFHNEKYNGIDLVHKINEKHENCCVIYISSILEFAPQVYESKHCYFVLKANMDVTLELAIKKSIKLLESLSDNEILEIICDSTTTIIKQKDIIFLERAQRAVKIGCVDEEYKCYQSLKQIAKSLSKNFVRCHQGFYINLEFVKKVGNGEVVMKNDVRIPIGGTYKSNFMQEYLTYCSLRM